MSTTKSGQMGQTRATALSRESDVREEARESARCFFNDLCRKRKKEEPGSKFKCNYSGHGNLVSQVFDDKNLVSVEAVVCFMNHLCNTVWCILLDLKVSRKV